MYTTRPGEVLPCWICAELAQLDRASVYETEGRRFDSCIPRHLGFGSSALSVSPLPRFQIPGHQHRGGQLLAGFASLVAFAMDIEGSRAVLLLHALVHLRIASALMELIQDVAVQIPLTFSVRSKNVCSSASSFPYRTVIVANKPLAVMRLCINRE